MRIAPLSTPHLPSFLDRLYGSDRAPDRGKAWTQHVADASDDARVPQLGLDGDRVVAAMWLAETHPGHWILSMPRTAPGADPGPLVEPLVRLARTAGISHLNTRQSAEHLEAGLEDALLAQGFEVFNERVEFKLPVSDLPEETPSPFTWVDHGTLTLGEVGRLIDRAGVGPEWEEHDVGERIAADHLASTGTALQVGLLDGQPAAFVLPKVEISSGWSTLSFLGLVPELRGRGLGAHIHRRGFALLRQLGGVDYHGGTSAANAAMRALFVRHGCRLHLELTELALDLD